MKSGVRRSAVARTPSRKSLVSRSQSCSTSSWSVAMRTRGRPGRGAWCGGWSGRREARNRRFRRPSRGRRHAQLLDGGKGITEADLKGLLALHTAARVEEVERLLLADEGGEGDGEAEPVMEAEPGEVGGEASLGGGHAEVGGEREPEPAADGGALHGGNDGRLRFEQSHGFLVEMAAAGAAGRLGSICLRCRRPGRGRRAGRQRRRSGPRKRGRWPARPAPRRGRGRRFAIARMRATSK